MSFHVHSTQERSTTIRSTRRRHWPHRGVPRRKAPAGPDFYFINGGSVGLLRPITAAAKAWVDDHVCLDEWQSARSVAIEHRYVVDILQGIANDGLVVA